MLSDSSLFVNCFREFTSVKKLEGPNRCEEGDNLSDFSYLWAGAMLRGLAADWPLFGLSLDFLTN
jgi:hypothetical protein